jgi:hypothetical protein
VTTTRVDLADIKHGDVINYTFERDSHTGQVAAVERITGDAFATHVVLFRGGKVAYLSGQVDRLDDEAAERWRADRDRRQRRTELADFLEQLASKVRTGLPMPSYDWLSVTWEVAGKTELSAVADQFGVLPEFRQNSNYLNLDIRPGGGRNEIGFYCVHKPEPAEQEATA